MTILVIAEHDNTELKASTLNTVAAATRLEGDIDLLVAGRGGRCRCRDNRCGQGAAGG